MTDRCPDGARHVIVVCGEFDEAIGGSAPCLMREVNFSSPDRDKEKALA